MTIKIKATPIKNPMDLSAPLKYYPRVISQGESTLESIAISIASKSSLGVVDVKSVLWRITEEISNNLQEGKIINLVVISVYGCQ